MLFLNNFFCVRGKNLCIEAAVPTSLNFKNKVHATYLRSFFDIDPIDQSPISDVCKVITVHKRLVKIRDVAYSVPLKKNFII